MALTVTLDLPPDVEARLRAETSDLGSEVKESYAVHLYRQAKLTHFQLSKMLGLDRFETDGVLKRHGVMLELTPERFEEELADLRKMLNP